MVAARAAWQAARAAVVLEDWVLVDECGMATDLARRYGWALGGARAPGAAPSGRWGRLTIFGGLTLAGLTACMSLAGAADTAGVTAAFNLNMLRHLNRELGAGFDLRRSRHRALFDEEASRVEMHLQRRTAQSLGYSHAPRLGASRRDSLRASGAMAGSTPECIDGREVRNAHRYTLRFT